jgi:hypothetical protein
MQGTEVLQVVSDKSTALGPGQREDLGVGQGLPLGMASHGLVGTGKDIWEVIAVVRDKDGDPAEAARYLEIPLGLVQAAV